MNTPGAAVVVVVVVVVTGHSFQQQPALCLQYSSTVIALASQGVLEWNWLLSWPGGAGEPSGAFLQ